MSPDVTLQEPRPGEALSAVGALAALVVRAEVHGEGGHGDVGLVAVRALSGFLVLQRSVRKQRGTIRDLMTLYLRGNTEPNLDWYHSDLCVCLCRARLLEVL